MIQIINDSDFLSFVESGTGLHKQKFSIFAALLIISALNT